MSISKYTLIAIFLSPLLAACAAGPDLAKTKKMSITGSGVMVTFNEALHREYLKLATLENDESDTDDAHYFNGKAMSAAMGKKVGPQPIKERKLPKKNKPELQAARGALVAELGSGGPKYHPAASARAQAMFDCWMQEQEENDQPKDIARCRAAFDKALKQISARPSPMPAPMVKAKPMPKPMPKKPQNFVVLFDFDSAAITATAQAIINEAIIAAQAVGPSRVGVIGHTDLAGSNKYNDALSRRRARAVSEILMNAGIKGAVISPAYLGEEDPALKTPDGTRASSNRRVTISVE